jgi:hypothetical protein
VNKATPTPTKLEWKDALAIAAALALTGLGWAAKHPEAALSLVAVALIWIINFLFRWKKIILHKAWLTTFLFFIALVLSAIFNPTLLPAWPVLSGDAQQIASAFYGWIGALIISAGPIVAYTTGIYNILLARVLDKLQYKPPEDQPVTITA